MSGPGPVFRDEAITEGTPHSPAPVDADVDVSPDAIAALIADGLRVVQDDTPALTAVSDAHALLVGVTHDLRSPIGSLLVLLERLRTGQAGPVTPQQERLLGLCYAAAFGMASLTADAFDMARGDRTPLTQGPTAHFSVRALWREVRALVQPIAEEKGLVLRFAGPEQDERMGYPRALQRVLLNLVTNALKYTDTGAVTVSVTALTDGEARFAVHDTGGGFATPTTPSTGLGLAMCRQLLAGMASDLVIDTSAGTCLHFTVALPPAPSRAVA